MLISPEQAQDHLRSDPAEAADVALKTRAAELLAMDYLDRKVYATPEAMAAGVLDGTAGKAPILVDDLIRAGILLILGHLYEHREDVVTGAAVELPMGSKALLRGYRLQGC